MNFLNSDSDSYNLNFSLYQARFIYVCKNNYFAHAHTNLKSHKLKYLMHINQQKSN